MTAALRVLAAGAALAAWSYAQQGPVRVLFIGNSYTAVNHLPDMLARLSEAAPAGPRIETESATRGGATLAEHWSDPKTRAQLGAGKWTYVVLQEQSLLGNKGGAALLDVAQPTAFLATARRWNAEIRKTGARTLFYLTWARRLAPENQARLTEAYRTAGRELDASVVPAGLAWTVARIESPGIELYRGDGSHPSYAGTYLTACVFYGWITGRAPVGLTVPDPASLSADDARRLQNIAWRVVRADPGAPLSIATKP